MEFFAKRMEPYLAEAIEAGEYFPRFLLKKGYIPYGPTRVAAINGHFDVLKFIYQFIPTYLFDDVIESNSYEAPCMAAANGHLDVLTFLLEKYPSKKWSDCS